MLNTMLSKSLALLLAALWLVSFQRPSLKNGSDWPDWRGPARDGVSLEKGFPEKWSPKGENLVWKVPFGGRSAPIVMGGPLVRFQRRGVKGETMQERLLCLDANTGKVIWERRKQRLRIRRADTPHRPGHRPSAIRRRAMSTPSARAMN